MAEVGAALFVACLPIIPRLFRRSLNQPSKVASQISYTKSRGPEAHNRYVEMEDDEVQLNSIPSTQVSVGAKPRSYETESLSTPERSRQALVSASGKSGPQIHRTISITQTTHAI